MKVLCKYYTNNMRLAAGVASFSEEPGFRFFCIEGSLVKVKSVFKILTGSVTVLVSCISSQRKKSLIVVLTSNPEYEKYDKQVVEKGYFIRKGGLNGR